MLRPLDQRWERRRAAASSGVSRLQVTASATIVGRTQEAVWTFARAAESSVLLEPDVVRAFTVPGTGPGVGEQQCFVRRVEGREIAQLLTIVAVEEGSWAETVSDGSDSRTGARTEVERIDEGARLTLNRLIRLHPGFG